MILWAGIQALLAGHASAGLTGLLMGGLAPAAASLSLLGGQVAGEIRKVLGPP